MTTALNANEFTKVRNRNDQGVAKQQGFSLDPIEGWNRPYQTSYPDGTPITLYLQDSQPNAQSSGSGFGQAMGKQFWGNARFGFNDGGLVRTPAEMAMVDDYTSGPIETPMGIDQPLMETDPRIQAILQNFTPEEIEDLLDYIDKPTLSRPIQTDNDLDALLEELRG